MSQGLSSVSAPLFLCVSVCPADAHTDLLVSCVCSPQNGRDYGLLLRQNSELLRALEEMEKSCSALREENMILVTVQTAPPNSLVFEEICLFRIFIENSQRMCF